MLQFWRTVASSLTCLPTIDPISYKVTHSLVGWNTQDVMEAGTQYAEGAN